MDCAATEQFYSLNNELDTARQSSSVSAQGEYDSKAQKVREALKNEILAKNGKE